ncbi:MAG: HD domain-containing protein [Spirochaetales bacterium]|nr:HD domain-containing protein [Spirochaetales bacterium]MCF7938718.1 HD domain-containing protein [Spirochaetales bacterium]
MSTQLDRRLQDKLQDIIHLDSYLNTIQDLDILLERILFEARKMVSADAGSIYIRNDNELAIQYSQNDTKQKEIGKDKKLIYSIFSIPINEKTISGYAAHTHKLVNIPDVYQIPEGAPYGFNPKFDRISGYRTTSVLAVPLVSNTGDLLGVLQMINKMGRNGEVLPFTQQDELFVTHFAANAVVALQRAQMTRAIILRMIRMAELRDPKETGAHVNRVAGFAAEIYERWAFKQGKSEQEIQREQDILKMAAMLHDVGKVAISDTILKKPGGFTDEEYEIMKAHTYLGSRLFGDKQSIYDEVSAEVALRHHENWDGTGYPGHIDVETGEPLQRDGEGRVIGLRGEEIPIYGRIVSIADVFDALSSKRVYKEAWDEEKTLEEMRKMAGSKFDPDLVDCFFEVLPNLKQIVERYPNHQ